MLPAWRPRKGEDAAVLLRVRDPFSPRLRRSREGIRGGVAVAMVWPCPLAVDAYVAAGRDLEFPRPACPSCAGPLVSWSGYRRYVRAAGRSRRIFVPRLRCGRCEASHALLPAFALAWRLDTAETIGTVIAEVAGGGCGIRPAAARAGVPFTTARGWVRRFRARGPWLGAGFAALAVELGGQAIGPAADAGAFAVAAPAFHFRVGGPGAGPGDAAVAG